MKTVKQTIPKGWQLKQIKDLLDYERPDNYIVKSANYTDAAKTAVLTANKSFVLGYTDEDFGIYKDTPAIIFDDFTTDSKYVDFPFKVKSSAIKILKNKNDDIDLRFVFEKMKSINFPTGNHKRFYISQYQNMEVAIPPLQEQRNIADILSTLSAEIDKTEEIISKTKTLKIALTKTLLEGGINTKEVKKTSLGEIPSEWEIVTLGEITKQRSVKNTSGTVKNVVSVTKYLGIVNSLDYFNKQVFSKDISTYKVIRPGDFAYATIHLDEGSIGFLDSEEDAVLSPMYTVFSVDYTRVDRDFLFSLLKSHRLMNLYRNMGLGSVDRRKSISYENFSKITIALPPLKQQKEIMNILVACEDKVLINQKICDRLTLLKKGLMQDLLSGKKLTV
jgi:type I restriction enzyme S subunit